MAMPQIRVSKCHLKRTEDMIEKGVPCGLVRTSKFLIRMKSNLICAGGSQLFSVQIRLFPSVWNCFRSPDLHLHYGVRGGFGTDYAFLWVPDAYSQSVETLTGADRTLKKRTPRKVWKKADFCGTVPRSYNTVCNLGVLFNRFNQRLCNIQVLPKHRRCFQYHAFVLHHSHVGGTERTMLWNSNGGRFCRFRPVYFALARLADYSSVNLL